MCSLYLGENLISGNKPINLGVRNIGEIVYSSLPLTDAGLHLLDGSLILGGGIYQGFVDYIANIVSMYPDVFTTESDWQSSVTTKGVCGKFVYDSTNNTVRLPKVTGKIDGTTDINTLGDLEPLFVKLPNITGKFNISGQDSALQASGSGAFYRGSTFTSYGNYHNANVTMYSVGFDASRSSSVYSGNGSDTSIHEQAIKCFIYIVIATSSKTEIQTDIDEVVTDLNGKADTDLTNVTDSAKVMMSGMGMPSGKYIDLTLGASGTTYTAPANGWVIVGKRCTANQYLGTYSNTIMKCLETWDSSYCSLYFPVKKGDIFPISYTAAGKTEVFRFIYAQGSESEAQ